VSAQIAGVVRGAGGEPVPGAVVALGGASPEHRDIAALTDAAGRYRYGSLTPGTYTVIVNAPGRAAASADVAVGEGETASLDFDLR
jgi:hypothetical protein